MNATIRRHPLIVYVVIAYAVSWLCWLPNLGVHFGWFDSAPNWIALLGALGPAVAALVVTHAVAGQMGQVSLLRRLTHWRVGMGWWLASLGPLLLFAAAVFALALTGNPVSSVSFTGFALLQSLMHGFGEEIGWRGFALPRLQSRFNALVSSVLLSVVWAGWHLPALLTNPTYQQLGLGGLIGWYFSLLTGSVLLTWLYNGTNGSLLVVSVFHTLLDVSTINQGPLVANIIGAAITVWGIAALVWTGARTLSKSGQTITSAGVPPVPVRLERAVHH